MTRKCTRDFALTVYRIVELALELHLHRERNAVSSMLHVRRYANGNSVDVIICEAHREHAAYVGDLLNALRGVRVVESGLQENTGRVYFRLERR